jgi:hypothetical protein
MVKYTIIVLMLVSNIALAQLIQTAPIYFQLSAYQANNDSTLIAEVGVGTILQRVIVIVDTFWAASDTLNIGTTGYDYPYPGNIWSSTTAKRGADETTRLVWGLDETGMGNCFLVRGKWCLATGNVYLYHPGLTSDIRGRIIVYLWLQDMSIIGGYTPDIIIPGGE